jgi:hypothetical protein
MMWLSSAKSSDVPQFIGGEGWDKVGTKVKLTQE